ncbi:hypothetical protein HYDPIDRAFT_29257 [Hydnomerulius pinastri MD-312]|uniref:Uncharacterized protein n=1 Tax=Hydnomerulius pinastri MD-312 TaxID=994086 RepID=A0A0C9VEB7_9AGAM|nr:hypothetical protein HYDPIDRAFT_29257 [Hydnomerulius pinastri MD-312]
MQTPAVWSPPTYTVPRGQQDRWQRWRRSGITRNAPRLTFEHGRRADYRQHALITSFGLDSLGATRYSNQLKARFIIQVSQIELLGSMIIGTLNEMHAKAGAQAGGEDTGFATDDGSAKYGEPLIPNFKLDRLPLLIATVFDLGGGDWAFNRPSAFSSTSSSASI